MPSKLIFIHGTDVRDTKDTVTLIQERVHRVDGFEGKDVMSVDWGKAVGPDSPLDMESILPKDITRGIGLEEWDGDSENRWLLLAAYPFTELSALQYWPGARAGITMPNAFLPSEGFADRLKGLPGAASGDSPGNVFTTSEWQSATQTLTAANLFSQVVDRRGRDDELVLQAVADTVVALLVHGRTTAVPAERRGMPGPESLDALATAVLADAGASRGAAMDWVLRKVVLPSAVRYAKKNRVQIMTGVASFGRDITFYLQHGELIRNHILRYLRENAHDKQVVIGHSLGGVAALDVLTENAASLPFVELLVTVGSQSSLLFQLDSLHSIRRSDSPTKPFPRWLNIYDPSDLLSFRVDSVFNGDAIGSDKQVNNGLEFPESHSGYFLNEQVYDAIGERLKR